MQPLARPWTILVDKEVVNDSSRKQEQHEKKQWYKAKQKRLRVVPTISRAVIKNVVHLY